MTTVVNGQLTIHREKQTYSAGLVERAAKENVPLPPLSKGLSTEAIAQLDRLISIRHSRWFIDEEVRSQSNHLTASDALGDKSDFAKKLNEVLELIKNDNCVANGEFILVGNKQGDIERWKIDNNRVSKEAIILTWPTGEIYRPVEYRARW